MEKQAPPPLLSISSTMGGAVRGVARLWMADQMCSECIQRVINPQRVRLWSFGGQFVGHALSEFIFRLALRP